MMRMASGAKDTKGFAVSSTITYSSRDGLVRSLSTERDIYKKFKHRGFLPLANSLEYEGLYNEFYFDIGLEDEKIFSPKYSYCKTEDPFSKEQEHYLVVGLTSKYDGEGIVKHGRNPFNLVVAIDISGSMASTFHTGDDVRSKMEITTNSVLSIISLLKPGDRFGCVSFNDDVTELQELKLIEEIDIPTLKQAIISLKPNGGTALTAAMKKSTSMFAGIKSEKEVYQKGENTIIILTDLVPSKDASTNTFVNTVKRNAQERLYTTIVGIGSEFSSDLLKRLGTIRACNYHSVHSAQDFKQIIDHEFIYTLSPCAFDISLNIDSDKFAVERVYGSPGNEFPTDGTMLTMDCNSPSPVDEKNRTQGGIVLAKLKPLSPLTSDTFLNCRLVYNDRNGEKHSDEQKVEVPCQPDQPNIYKGEAGRKSVLLTRYINLVKQWVLDEQKRYHAAESEDSEIYESIVYRPSISLATGILPIEKGRDQKQKKRIPFHVDSHYLSLFSAFAAHFKEEIAALNDTGLESCIQKIEGIASYVDVCCKTTKEGVEKNHTNCLAVLTKSGNTAEMSPQQADVIILKSIKEGRLSLLEYLWPLVEKSIHEERKLAFVKLACQCGRPKILHLLISYLPTPDVPKPPSISFFQKLITPIPPQAPPPHPDLTAAVLQAAQKGNVKCLRQMLAFAPIDLNAHVPKALPNAYSYGKSECVKFLLDRGASTSGIMLKDIQRDLDGEQGSSNKNEVDLVFCCDTTGSMGSFLESAQDSIRDIVTDIATKGESNVRFGLVKYKDHPPECDTYVTEVHEFTYELNRMKAYVDTMEASGGGDSPECLVDGMEACLNLNFRPNATKIVCIITDAAPHALDPKDDGFPDGCPCGFDPLEIARLMAERGIIVYTLGAEPLSNCNRDFLTAVAHITEGQYVPLGDAATLRQVIVGGAIEELDLKRLIQEAQVQYDSIKALGLDEDDAILRITENLQKQQLKVKQLVLPDVYSGKDTTNIAIYEGASTLIEARSQIKIDRTRSNEIKNALSTYQTEHKIISLKQVTRLWSHIKK